MRGIVLARPTIRVALALGFGVSLGLWVFTGYTSTSGLARSERETAALTARYLRAQDRLSTVRTQVLLSSMFVRDALLDPELVAVPDHRERLEQAHAAMKAALDAYEPLLDSLAERAEIARLREAVREFQDVTAQVLAADAAAADPGVRRVLHELLVPRREAAIRVSEQVQTLNRTAYIQHQVATASIARAAQERSWRLLGLGLAASLAVALVATLYASRLERRLVDQLRENGRQAQDLQRLSSQLILAHEEERRHIARELHDEVGQVLTAVNVELSRAQWALEARGGPSFLLEDAQRVTHGALRAVRDLSQLLRPVLLDDLGLAAALENLIGELARRHGLAVSCTATGLDGRLDPALEVAAYRIVQEALTNAVRHARAASCEVRVARMDGVLQIEVRDDGIGFDVESAMHGEGRQGVGLVGMRERAELLRGRVSVESAVGRGTVVRAVLPVDEARPGGTRPGEQAAAGAVAVAPEAANG